LISAQAQTFIHAYLPAPVAEADAEAIAFPFGATH